MCARRTIIASPRSTQAVAFVRDDGENCVTHAARAPTVLPGPPLRWTSCSVKTGSRDVTNR